MFYAYKMIGDGWSNADSTSSVLCASVCSDILWTVMFDVSHAIASCAHALRFFVYINFCFRVLDNRLLTRSLAHFSISTFSSLIPIVNFVHVPCAYFCWWWCCFRWHNIPLGRFGRSMATATAMSLTQKHQMSTANIRTVAVWTVGRGQHKNMIF